MDYFASRCKVIALDLIGHGVSIGKGDIAETSNVVSAILEKENVLKSNMVGVSMGAVLAASPIWMSPRRSTRNWRKF